MSVIPPLIEQDLVYSEPEAKANLLNQYFITISTMRAPPPGFAFPFS